MILGNCLSLLIINFSKFVYVLLTTVYLVYCMLREICVVVQCFPEDMIFSCHKLIPLCLKTPPLIVIYLTSCRVELGLVWLVDVIILHLLTVVCFNLMINTVFTIVSDCGDDHPIKGYYYYCSSSRLSAFPKRKITHHIKKLLIAK
jgi:hypothetical protein